MNSSPPLAGHGVRAAHAAHDPAGGFHQQVIARFVAEGVVHFLETIEVDEQHRHAVVVPGGLLHQFGQAVVEQAPVGQAGEGIVIGLHPDQGFGLLALGDVGDDTHQPTQAAIGLEVGGLVEDDVTADTIGGFHRGFIGLHARMVEQGLVGFVVTGRQVRRSDVEHRAADQLAAGPSIEGFEGFVAAQVAGLLVLEKQRAGNRLDELPDEAELFGRRTFGGTAGGDVYQHADDGRAAFELGAVAEDFEFDQFPVAVPALKGVVSGVSDPVDAVGNGVQYFRHVLFGDQRPGADMAANIGLRVAEHFRKAWIDVAKQLVLDDVNPDQRIAQQSEKESVRFADQVFGEGFQGDVHGAVDLWEARHSKVCPGRLAEC